MKSRIFRRAFVASSLVILSLTLGVAVIAGSPWDIFGTAKTVECDRNKAYELTDRQGPWLIYAGSFAGEGAREDALDLLHELREKHSFEAYLYKVEFDFGGTVEGLGWDDDKTADGRLQGKRMRHLNDEKVDEYAVMVGNYVSLDDPRIEGDLTKIKHLHPECLELDAGETTTKTFFSLRAIQDRLNLSAEVKGPLRAAFKSSNPLLPPEYFKTNGVTKLVENMNADVQYGLLDCEGLWTVRVATFQGKRAVSLEKDYTKLMEQQVSDSLHEAAMKAHDLTMELRRQGVEAYEFHDIDKSIVTVGSFQEVGKSLGEGRPVEMHPEIFKIIETFKPATAGVAGALRPKTMKGIAFDIQPWPIEVPKRSLASAYLGR